MTNNTYPNNNFGVLFSQPTFSQSLSCLGQVPKENFWGLLRQDFVHSVNP